MAKKKSVMAGKMIIKSDVLFDTDRLHWKYCLDKSLLWIKGGPLDNVANMGCFDTEAEARAYAKGFDLGMYYQKSLREAEDRA